MKALCGLGLLGLGIEVLGVKGSGPQLCRIGSTDGI